MKNLGRIEDAKDITTKEYVDSALEKLDTSKISSSDLQEYTSEEVQSVWKEHQL